MVNISFELDGEKIFLPYASDFNIEEGYEDYIHTSINGNTYLVNGSKKLREFEVSYSVSKRDYTFHNINAPKNFLSYKDFFEKARKNKKPLRVVVTNGDLVLVSMLCLVEFNYSNFDSVNDIPVSIKVKEYKVIK